MIKYLGRKNKMKNSYCRKRLVFAVVLLFVGAGVVSGINSEVEKIENLSRNTLIFIPTDDGTIRHYAPNEPAGSYHTNWVQNEYGATSGWACDSLIKFDISSIPPDTEIESAVLYLYYYAWGMNNPAGRDINLYRITSDWVEETVTWNIQPSYASQPTTYATVPSSTGVWNEWDVTSDVQGFISGSSVNYGWKLTDENYWGTFDIPQPFWRSKDFSGDDVLPYLEIETENGGSEFKTTFIIGKIDNLNTDEDMITFEAVNLRCLQFSPFGFIPYTSGELITISKDYMGLLTLRFIFALCGASL